MTNRISLAAILLFSAAAPLWAFLTYAISQSPGFGPLAYAVVPLVLISATAAIYKLTRKTWGGLALSSLIAVIVLTGTLMLVALWARSQ